MLECLAQGCGKFLLESDDQFEYAQILMPELPEVETIRRGLVQRVLKKKIRGVEIRAEKVVKNDPKEFIRTLTGNTFTKIDRRGKLLILHLRGVKRAEKPRFLLIHMKLTGQLIYQQGETLVAGGHYAPSLAHPLPHRHTRVIFEFADGSRLFFNDLRKFGVLKIVDRAARDLVLAAYGVEPLSREFTWERFQKALGRRQAPLKAVLRNQALIAGLGNIYVEEVAWHARVSPSRRVARLTETERKNLFRAIPKVLIEAIAWGGTTFRHFRNSQGKEGNYSDRLRAYGRSRKACRRCGGVMVRTTVAQRGTTYCPRCQK